MRQHGSCFGTGNCIICYLRVIRAAPKKNSVALLPNYQIFQRSYATRYGLDGSGFEPRWRQEILFSPCPSGPALGPI